MRSNLVAGPDFQHRLVESRFRLTQKSGGIGQRSAFGFHFQICNRLTDADETKIGRTALDLMGHFCGLDGIVFPNPLPQLIQKNGSLVEILLVDFDKIRCEAIGDHVKLFPINGGETHRVYVTGFLGLVKLQP